LAIVSGSDQHPTVDLLGTSMSALVLAIPAIAERTGRDVIVVGGSERAGRARVDALIATLRD
jgi:hypothetical protein